MLSQDEVEKGVTALLAIESKQPAAITLVDYPDKIEMQFTLKRILYKDRKVLTLNLPHSLHHKAREVCVFVKDLDQKSREYEDTVEHYEDLFKAKNVKEIAKIIPIKALKTDYSQPGAMKSLSRAYDLYLADECVFGTLPALLGKKFFSKKSTVPVQVNLGAKDLQKEVGGAVGNARCEMNPHGNSHITTVAHSWMDKSDIVDNVLAAANQLAQKLHGGQKIIRNIAIKRDRTMAVPIYVNLEDPGQIPVQKRKQSKIEEFTDEVTTVEGGPVHITAEGFVEVLGDTKPVIDRRNRNKGKRGRGKRDRSQSAGGKKAKLDKKGVDVKVEADDSSKVGSELMGVTDKVKEENNVSKKMDSKAKPNSKPVKKGSKMMRFKNKVQKTKKARAH